MGVYLNPGNEAFRECVTDELYVDKTELIDHMNSKLNKARLKYVCVSRPRRFGKSMAADMLVAYYGKNCDSRELFAGRKIEKADSYETHLNQHHVIRLDIQRFLFRKSHIDIFIDEIQRLVVQELEAAYGDGVFQGRGELPDSSQYGLPGALSQIYARTGEKFIFIIDEWDCVFRFARERQDVQKAYLDFLRGLFKGAEYVELAYMTGILPVKKYGEHSALNMFSEYSVIDSKDLGEFFGFTREEVRELCVWNEVEYTEVEKWYDGYLLKDMHIYNPKAVTDVMTWKEFRSYWTGTETYEALKVYINQNFDGLKEDIATMLGDGRCRVNPETFQNDMTTFTSKDDIYALLIHLGYLTFDESTSEAFIPNLEISQEFLKAMDGPDWSGITGALRHSVDLLKATWALDGAAVAEGIGAIHDETTSILKYNDENSLKCTVLIAYYSAKAYYLPPALELPSGKGYADIVYLPRKNMDYPALLIELKWKHSDLGAIAQIKEKQYAHWVKEYTGDILLVGINYDENKGHECLIEKYVVEKE